MSIHYGGRGPGHLARVQRASGPPQDGSYSLLMDFVGDDDDTDWINLNLDFVAQSYRQNTADPSVPAGTYVNILVWR